MSYTQFVSTLGLAFAERGTHRGPVDWSEYLAQLEDHLGTDAFTKLRAQFAAEYPARAREMGLA